VPIVLKSRSLKLLESSGPVQARNGIALTPRKYTVLNGKFLFGLRDVFQERIPFVKRNPNVKLPFKQLDIIHKFFKCMLHISNGICARNNEGNLGSTGNY